MFPIAFAAKHRTRFSQFHLLALKTVLLTGDEKHAAQEIGKALHIDETGSGLLPHEKAQRVRQMTAAGLKVAMVGDGVNDAPALAEAAVGIAMGSGTDVARETADGLLIGNDLLKVAAAVRTSRWCRRIIMQNFYGTIAVDLCGIGLAAWGMINPLTAAFIHVASEMTFILNSSRLLGRGINRTTQSM